MSAENNVSKSADAAGFPPIRVMVVDDSLPMRQVHRKHLNDLGIVDVVEAKDGKDALEKLADDNAFTFIMMDINMPRVGGIECLIRLKKDPRLAHIPVFVCTCQGNAEDVAKLIKIGASNYMVKPFTRETLQAKLLVTLKKFLEKCPETPYAEAIRMTLQDRNTTAPAG